MFYPKLMEFLTVLNKKQIFIFEIHLFIGCKWYKPRYQNQVKLNLCNSFLNYRDQGNIGNMSPTRKSIRLIRNIFFVELFIN